MPDNFPGPYEVRLNYSVTINSLLLNHQQKLSLALAADPPPGTTFPLISALSSDGSTFDQLSVYVDAWVAGVVDFYSNNSLQGSWTGAELWKYTEGTFDAQFISAYSFTTPGTSGSAASESAQSIVTFRTTAGGIFKLSFMESVIVPGSIDVLPFSNTALNTLCGLLIDGTLFPWLARDGGWPFATLSHFPGQNEALFKKRRRAGV